MKSERWKRTVGWWLRGIAALAAMYGARWILLALGSGKTADADEFNQVLNEVIELMIGPWGIGLAWVVAVGCVVAGLVVLSEKPAPRDGM